MAINENTKINFTLVSSVSAVLLLVSVSFGLGSKQMDILKEVDDNTKKSTKNARLIEKNRENLNNYKLDVTKQLSDIQADVRFLVCKEYPEQCRERRM